MDKKPLSLHVTVPSLGEAKTLARVLLQKRLVACVNLLQSKPSLYWWQGKIEEADEILLLAKTRSDKKDELLHVVPEHHPDEVPCIVFLPIEDAAPSYRRWMDEALDGP